MEDAVKLMTDHEREALAKVCPNLKGIPLGWGFWKNHGSDWQGNYPTKELAAAVYCEWVNTTPDASFDTFKSWAKTDRKNEEGVLQTYADLWAEDRDEITRLEARLRIYEDFVIAYGTHKSWCATRSRAFAAAILCDCGFHSKIRDLMPFEDAHDPR